MIVAESLTKLLEEVVAVNSYDAWSALLLFPFAGLQTPKKKVRNLTKWVKDHVKLWNEHRSSSVPDDRLPQDRVNKLSHQQQIAKKVEA